MPVTIATGPSSDFPGQGRGGVEQFVTTMHLVIALTPGPAARQSLSPAVRRYLGTVVGGMHVGMNGCRSRSEQTATTCLTLEFRRDRIDALCEPLVLYCRLMRRVGKGNLRN